MVESGDSRFNLQKQKQMRCNIVDILAKRLSQSQVFLFEFCGAIFTHSSHTATAPHLGVASRVRLSFFSLSCLLLLDYSVLAIIHRAFLLIAIISNHLPLLNFKRPALHHRLPTCRSTYHLRLVACLHLHPFGLTLACNAFAFSIIVDPSTIQSPSTFVVILASKSLLP